VSDPATDSNQRAIRRILILILFLMVVSGCAAKRINTFEIYNECLESCGSSKDNPRFQKCEERCQSKAGFEWREDKID
jgi:hypothetical protein